MKKIMFFSLIISLINCQGNVEETTNEINNIEKVPPIESPSVELIGEEETLSQEIISFDTFTEFPPEIDGCACYFSKDTTDFKLGKYIYMDDFGSEFGFLKIDGELIQFNLEISLWDEEKGSHNELSYENYTVTMDYKQVAGSGEVFEQEGTLTLDTGNGQGISISFYGECGC